MMTRTTGRVPAVACPGGSPGESPRRLPDMDDLYNRLAEADEADDTAALATLAWELYGLLGSLMADRNSLRSELHQVLAGAVSGRRSASFRPAGKACQRR